MSNPNRTRSSRNNRSGRSNIPTIDPLAGSSDQPNRQSRSVHSHRTSTPGLESNPRSQFDVPSTYGPLTHPSRTGSSRSQASGHPSHRHSPHPGLQPQNRDRIPARASDEFAAHMRANKHRYEEAAQGTGGTGLWARMKRRIFGPQRYADVQIPLPCDIIVAERNRARNPEGPPPGQPRYQENTPQPRNRAERAARGYRGRRLPRAPGGQSGNPT